MMLFEWDPAKARTNIAKHGVSFERAVQVFEGPVLTYVDQRFGSGDVREIAIGCIGDTVILTVIHTDRNGVTRIISARPASRAERRRYEQALRQRTDT
ncbi:BrnT family toxin [Afifella sp. JA880]|uniref:BrnT family toxin n=1 Tax=unclassified Afifella TaxID=2624128 RepID=UPI0021BBB0C7|nr:BrnT family toxin [Afifella sp. JA880]MCT8266652.1 BrnT family toxin [Afifella sp. JA880]